MWKKIKALHVLLPRKIAWRTVILGCALIGLVVGAFCLGRLGALSNAQATPPAQPTLVPQPPLLPVHKTEDPGQPVAYIYKNIPITRQDLGEYLIARFGAERLDFLVNRKIIEHVCRAKGISVSDVEIEAQLIEDLKAMNVVKLEDFVNIVLKRFGKTLYEYKEDVIRPKIAMDKLCRSTITVTEQEIKDAFEAKYGPMVQCRIIVLGGDKKERDRIWADLKNDPDDAKFKKYARTQADQALASNGGVVPPIHKHFGDKRVEAEAFSLGKGEISSILPMPGDTFVILKCDEHLPAKTNYRLEDEAQLLRHEVFERKLAEAIPKMFQELRKQADAKVFLRREQANDLARQRVNSALAKAAAARPSAASTIPLPPGIKE